MAVYRGVPWRFIFTDLTTATTTWADGLLTGRKITYGLNQPTEIDGSVYPDDKRVNLLYENDQYPLVAQSNRLIYCFRREAPPAVDGVTPDPWVCRAAGILMTPEDSADDVSPLTNFTAFDSWKYLEGRPVMDTFGGLPGPNGYQIYGVDAIGNIIACQILANTINALYPTTPAWNGFIPLGNGTGIDAGDGSRSGEGDQYRDWGGTRFYQGTLEETCPINYSMQQGTSVSDAWNTLCDAGNLDIVLTPIYDPINRPGYTHELNIYNLAGQNRPNSVFAWDMLRKNLKSIDRLHSAVPGDFFNQGVYFTSFGGWPITGAPNDASIATFTSYWNQSFQPSQPDVDPSGGIMLALLDQALIMAKQGKRTVTLSPIPERSPIPLQDYAVGDFVPVWSTNRLRVAMTDDFTTDPPAAFRVQGIPIEISDDGIETVDQLLVSPDWRTVLIGCGS